MKVYFLGTGTSQGIPIIGVDHPVCKSTDAKDKRLRVSIWITWDDHSYVIDCGPDFRQQLLREKIKRLDAVVFTHEHKDHIAGLDEVKAFNFINKMVMPVYATKRVQEALHREFAYIFSDEKYPGIPEIKVIDFDNEPFFIGDILLNPVNVMHFKLPVKGFRINDFAYITDANFIAAEEKERLKGLNVLVLNALRREPHISHFTFEEAIELVKELKPKKAYFTHISHQLGLHENIAKELPENIELAVDGLQLIL